MEKNNVLIKNLNDNQLEAILYTENLSIIIAGAGVGKTRVLTHKIAYLIAALKVKPEKILALTFTNKAAKEMKSRVGNLLNDDNIKVNIFTYHALCAHILRRDSHNLNFKGNFNLIDTSDQKQILKEIYNHDFNYKADATELKLIIRFISEWKNYHVSKEEIIEDYNNQENWVLRANVYERYQAYLKTNNCIDFDDLLLNVSKLFKEYPDVAKKWQNQYDYVLVDEFQDTNNLQYEILLNLVAKHHNLTVVGDPDQTIYSWRGANINLILRFNEKFPEAKTFILNQNYRSTTKILNVANSLISNNKQRIKKNLFSTNMIGEDIYVYHAHSGHEEANWIANIIKKLVIKENIKLNEIAVLYRNNYLSNDLEQAFINHNLNYRIIGGFKFFERKEIKDILAYLKVFAWNDNLSMVRILNTVPKIGTKTIATLLEKANTNNLSLSEYLVMFQHNLPAKQKMHLQVLIDLIVKYQKKITSLSSIHPLLEDLLKDTNYLKILKDNFENDRIENVMQLMGQVVEFDQKNELLNNEELLSTFLQEVSLYTDADEDNKIEAVSLMTIHSAKGLEFNAVFIVGINDGVLPGLNQPTNQLSEKENKKLEEERRLLYVAITRAKKFLFLSSAGGFSYVLNKFRIPSRFFEELDFQHLKIISFNQSKETDMKKINPKNYHFQKTIAKNKHSQIYSNNKNPWKVNDLLVHEIFGKGIVTKIIGDKIQVAFNQKQGGIKVLNSNHPAIKKFFHQKK